MAFLLNLFLEARIFCSVKNCAYCFLLVILNAHIYYIFLKAQYPFSILYLPTQIQMDIVYRKTRFKHEISDVQNK